MSLKSEEELKNISFIKEESPWIEALTKKNKKLNDAFEKIKKDAGRPSEESSFIVPGPKKELFVTTSAQEACFEKLKGMFLMM